MRRTLLRVLSILAVVAFISVSIFLAYIIHAAATSTDAAYINLQLTVIVTVVQVVTLIIFASTTVLSYISLKCHAVPLKYQRKPSSR